MEIRRLVGKNVRELREQLDWSQEDLAHECEVHRTYVSGVERGIRNPTVVVLAKIAAALKVKTGRLLEE